MINNALYYPNIDFLDPGWVKGMALFYENIYRIVPNNVIPDDPEELQPLLEDPAIGRIIDPSKYSVSASENFINDKSSWKAAAFECNDAEQVEETLLRIHSAKIDKQVKDLFNSLGYENMKDDWHYVPTELASHFMLYLANEIAKKNQLNLITQNWAPWTATSYYNLDGCLEDYIPLYEQDNKYSDDPFALFSLMIGEITPININEIPCEKLLDFRIKRKDEIKRFRKTIYALYCELQKLEDPILRQDTINSKIKDLIKAKEDYHKCADVIKAQGWFGVSFMGVSAPVTLGTLFNIPSASIVTLGITALALGGIFNIQTFPGQHEHLCNDNYTSPFLATIKILPRVLNLRMEVLRHLPFSTQFFTLFDYPA